MKNAKFKKFYTIIVIILYKLAVDLCYVKVMTPVWSYMALYTDLNFKKWIVSILVIVLLGATIRWEGKQFSDTALQILFLITIIPMGTYYSLANKSTSFFLSCCLSFFITIFLTSTFPVLYFKRKIHIEDKKILLAVVCMVTVALLSTLVVRMGLNFRFLNIYDSESIYGARAGHSIKLDGIFTYIYLWGVRITLPFFSGVMFSKRKYVIGTLFALLQIAVYLGNPHKEILLGMLLMFVIVFFNRFISTGKIFMYGGIIFLILGTELYVIGNEYWIKVDALLSRLLYVPASIKFLHYEFFSVHDKLLFSEGRIGQLFGINYPFDTSVGIVIGRYFFGVDSNCNAGYLAYAYDDLGFWGVLLVSFLLFMVLRLMNRLIKRDTNIWIKASLVYPIILLNDSPFLSWLLSGGIIFLLFLLYICDGKKIYN